MVRGIDEDADEMSVLSEPELKSVYGGGWPDIIVDYLIKGVTYFFNMGYAEGRAQKAKMKTAFINI